MSSLENGHVSKSSTTRHHEPDIQAALACLQLPHMPGSFLREASDSSKIPQLTQHSVPTITILVCADIDLKSSSALAEYTLQQQNRVFDANAIDMIIAAGPCTRGDSDLTYYSQGTNDSYHSPQQQQRIPWKARRRLLQTSTNKIQADYDGTNSSGNDDDEVVAATDYRNILAMSPFFRTREESAGLEGLLTASISQLESIVCRVVYCPGWHDPLTVLQNQSSSSSVQQRFPKRLTPNSRNIHQQWMPLAPGLGCAGLFYLDGTDALVVEDDKRTNDQRAPNDDDSDASEEQDSLTILLEQVKKLQWYVQCRERLAFSRDSAVTLAHTYLSTKTMCSPSSYSVALSKLLQLGPKPGHPEVLFSNGSASKCQSILVTNYVDCQALLQREDDSDTKSISLCTVDPPNLSSDAYGDTSAACDVDDAKRTARTTTSAPWPLSGREDFIRSEATQQHLCFEIASGSAAHIAPEWIMNRTEDGATGKSDETFRSAPRAADSNGNNRHLNARSLGPVLLPGSLRERGEFSIVQLSLVEQKPGRHLLPRRFAWKVQNVDFHHINNFGQRSCH
jgi:hypothetical protein